MFVKLVDFVKRYDSLSVPHKGVVVDNDDPKKIGRVKCTVEDLFAGDDISKLPWVYPWNPSSQGGRADSSSLSAPEVGSELVIEFPFRDVYSGFYTGFWHSQLTNQGLFFEDYPNVYGFRDSQNNYVKVNKAKGYTELHHQSGVTLTVEKDGTTDLMSKKSITFVSEDVKTQMILDMVEGKISIAPRGVSEVTGEEHAVKSGLFRQQVGRKITEVNGSLEESIVGGSKTVVGGSRSLSVVGNKSESVLGDISNGVSGDFEYTFAKNLLENILNGNRTTNIKVGNYVLEITKGNITLKTNGGDVLIQTSNNGLVQVANLLELKGTLTKINAGTSPVLTTQTDPLIDLITGAKHVGVPSVLAG